MRKVIRLVGLLAFLALTACGAEETSEAADAEHKEHIFQNQTDALNIAKDEAETANENAKRQEEALEAAKH